MKSAQCDNNPPANTLERKLHVTSNKCIAVRKVATPLRELTCHMGSDSVTCHPAEVTFPPCRAYLRKTTDMVGNCCSDSILRRRVDGDDGCMRQHSVLLAYLIDNTVPPLSYLQHSLEAVRMSGSRRDLEGRVAFRVPRRRTQLHQFRDKVQEIRDSNADAGLW